MESQKQTNQANDSSRIHSLNVSELKEAQKPKKKVVTSDRWYDKLQYWLLFGVLLMLPVIVVGIFQNKFLIITPLGPVLGVISYFIRRFVKLHNLDVTQED